MGPVSCILWGPQIRVLEGRARGEVVLVGEDGLGSVGVGCLTCWTRVCHVTVPLDLSYEHFEIFFERTQTIIFFFLSLTGLK